jgi:hypothetical protein
MVVLVLGEQLRVCCRSKVGFRVTEDVRVQTFTFRRTCNDQAGAFGEGPTA